MHILCIIIAVLARAGIWLWRVRAAKETLDELSDAAMRAYSRAKFRRKTESSPFEAIDDPRNITAALMVTIAKCGG